jgi:hypothetical protein
MRDLGTTLQAFAAFNYATPSGLPLLNRSTTHDIAIADRLPSAIRLLVPVQRDTPGTLGRR